MDERQEGRKSGIARVSDVFVVPVGTSGQKTGHPAQYPVSLAEMLIQTFCPPNGIVLDPFAGSGSAWPQPSGSATIITASRSWRSFARSPASGWQEPKRACRKRGNNRPNTGGAASRLPCSGDSSFQLSRFQGFNTTFGIRSMLRRIRLKGRCLAPPFTRSGPAAPDGTVSHAPR